MAGEEIRFAPIHSAKGPYWANTPDVEIAWARGICLVTVNFI